MVPDLWSPRNLANPGPLHPERPTRSRKYYARVSHGLMPPTPVLPLLVFTSTISCTLFWSEKTSQNLEAVVRGKGKINLYFRQGRDYQPRQGRTLLPPNTGLALWVTCLPPLRSESDKMLKNSIKKHCYYWCVISCRVNTILMKSDFNQAITKTLAWMAGANASGQIHFDYTGIFWLVQR